MYDFRTICTILSLILLGWLIFRPLTIILIYNPINYVTKKKILNARQSEINKINGFIQKNFISPQKKTEIISKSVSELAKMLRAHEVTSTQILAAYYQECLAVGIKLNGIAAFNSDYAIKQASEIDLEIASPNFTFQNKSPFYGIPISIKESIRIKGMICALGLFSWAKKKTSAHDSEIIIVLKKLGAIPFVTSNIPFLMMANEVINPIWGDTKNPICHLRTAGGSSGGEGCLLGAKCTPFGIGTDLIGSLRMPSIFCGTYTLLPSCNRISNRDNNPYEGIENYQSYVPIVNGPMGRNVEDIILCMKCLYNQDIIDRDRTLIPLYWREAQHQLGLKGKIRLGCWISNDLLPITKPCMNSLNQAINIIKDRDKDIEIIKFELPDKLFWKLVQGMFILVMNDGKFLELFRGGINQFFPIKFFISSIGISASNSFKKIIYWLFRLIGEKRGAKFFENAQIFNGDTFLNFVATMKEAGEELESLFKKYDIQAIIGAGYPTPPFELGKSGDQPYVGFYNGIWNVNNYVAGIIPYGKVKKEDTSPENMYNDLLQKAINKCLKGSEGLPTSLLIGSTSYSEELVLGIMKRIDDILKTETKQKKK